MKRRVFLLGLDGASWNVLDRMFAAGHMPFLQRLACEGVRATLVSTVPPVTPVAWLSLMTGCNPGKHGVYGFLKPRSDNPYIPRIVNRMDSQVPTIFEYYREEGPIISLNLPMSYPATSVNGHVITCMMTPLGCATGHEHPRGLLERLARAGIDYVIDPKFKSRAGQDEATLLSGWRAEGPAFVTSLCEVTVNRFRAARMLMDEEEWSVFVLVAVGMDRLQHLHWDLLCPSDGGAPDPVLASYYRRLDQEIGETVAKLGPDDSLLVVSDHGFVRTHGRFSTNEWLRQQGLLAARDARRSPLYLVKRTLGAVGVTRERVERVLGRRHASRLHMVTSHVDHSHSRAYFDNPLGIRINLVGREMRGQVRSEDFATLREEIIGRLGELTDPTGERALQAVRCGSDVYWGDACEQASDISFLFRDERNYCAYGGELGGGMFQPTPFKTGDHRLDGILVAWGGGIRASRAPMTPEPRFAIWDVLPTLLHLNGRPVPEICDGRVLLEILSDPGEPRLDGDWRRFSCRGGEAVLEAGQQAEIEERLRALGYLEEN